MYWLMSGPGSRQPGQRMAPPVLEARILPVSPALQQAASVSPTGLSGRSEARQRRPAERAAAPVLTTDTPVPTPVPLSAPDALDSRGAVAASPSLDLGPDALAAALKRDRAWQEGQRGALRFPEAFRGTGGQALNGGPLQSVEQGLADGGRVIRVNGPGGSYCLRLPPAGQDLSYGAGPALAVPTLCPP